MYEQLFPWMPLAPRCIIASYATCELTPLFNNRDGRSITVIINK